LVAKLGLFFFSFFFSNVICSAEKKADNLQADVSKLKVELEAAKLQSELSKQDTTDVKEFEALVSQAEAEKAKLQKSVLDLEGKVATLQAKLTAAESNSKDKELALQLQSQLADQIALVDSLQAEIDELRSAAEEAAAPPPPPPAPAAPAPPSAPPAPKFSASSASSSSSVGGGAPQDLLSAIRGGATLKHVDPTENPAPALGEGDDVLSILARSIIDRRANMKEGEDDEEDDHWADE
jgi:hypothetical protein